MFESLIHFKIIVIIDLIMCVCVRACVCACMCVCVCVAELQLKKLLDERLNLQDEVNLHSLIKLKTLYCVV